MGLGNSAGELSGAGGEVSEGDKEVRAGRGGRAEAGLECSRSPTIFCTNESISSWFSNLCGILIPCSLDTCIKSILYSIKWTRRKAAKVIKGIETKNSYEIKNKMITQPKTKTKIKSEMRKKAKTKMKTNMETINEKK